MHSELKKQSSLRWGSALLLWVTLLILSTGCAQWSGHSGVKNVWRNDLLPEWIPGQTTASDVAEILGPPSQLIALHDETVFYYMRENTSEWKMTFILWNSGRQDTVYDRAIFFFNEDGTLRKHAYSQEQLPYEQ
jgi:hypothetical protein